MGYFHALRLAFLSSLIRKYMLWEGFYHDFSTKQVSASGGSAPWPPPRGSAPWTPEVTSPPRTIYPGAAPVYTYYLRGPLGSIVCFTLIMMCQLQILIVPYDFPGGITLHMIGYAPAFTKSVEKGTIFDIRRHRRLLQKGYIFHC